MIGDMGGFGGAHYLGNVVGLFRSPRELFRRLDRSAPWGAVAAYAVLWQVLSIVVTVVLSFVRPGLLPLGIIGKFVWLFVGPLVGVLGLLLISAVLFFVWHVMGSPHRFGVSLRAVALLTPLEVLRAVLGVVPFLHIVVLFLAAYLLVVISIEVHSLPARRSWAVWFSLLGLFLLIGFLATLAARPRSTPWKNLGQPEAAVDGAPRMGGQGMMPADLQKQMEEELKKHQENLKNLQKDGR